MLWAVRWCTKITQGQGMLANSKALVSAFLPADEGRENVCAHVSSRHAVVVLVVIAAVVVVIVITVGVDGVAISTEQTASLQPQGTLDEVSSRRWNRDSLLQQRRRRQRREWQLAITNK